MFILAWIGIGIATGVLARRPIKRSGRAILLDVSLGVVGAVCSGWLIETSRGVEDSRPTPSSLLFAMLGAVVVLVFYHTVVRDRLRTNSKR